MPINNGLYSSKTDLWATPQDFFDKLNDKYKFTLDPCATHENAKCKKYYTAEDDGLRHSWDGESVFMNPPYGRMIGKRVEKAKNTEGGGNSMPFASQNGYKTISGSCLLKGGNYIYQRTFEVWRVKELSALPFNACYIR